MALLNDYLELPCLQKKWVMVCVMVMHWMIFCLNGYDSVDKVDLFRPFLTQDASNAIAVSLIMSRLDYRNSTRWGLPADQLNHLQKIQNCAACIVTRTKSQEHITPVRRSLHWLPVSKQIEYKILFLTYQCAHKTTPQCLYNPPCSLLSFFSVQTEHLWVWWDTYKKKMLRSKVIQQCYTHPLEQAARLSFTKQKTLLLLGSSWNHLFSTLCSPYPPSSPHPLPVIPSPHLLPLILLPLSPVFHLLCQCNEHVVFCLESDWAIQVDTDINIEHL